MTTDDTTNGNVVPLSPQSPREDTGNSIARLKRAVARMNAAAESALASTAELNDGLAALSEQMQIMEDRLRHCDEIYSSSIEKLQASRAQSGNI